MAKPLHDPFPRVMLLVTLLRHARAYHRVLKVTRTIADLAGAEHIATAHLGEALQYRCLDRPVLH